MTRFSKMIALVAAGLTPASSAAHARPWRIEGQRLVDGDGKQVIIRGPNLGNWLFWEGWMFGGSLLGGESAMLDRIAQVVGPEATRRFKQDYEDSFITESDIAAMGRAGFNTIRLPINYRTLIRDPGCLACDGEGFRHIDQLLGWARAHGLHVILDMHVVPGAQSGLMTADTSLGHAEYWKDPRFHEQLLEIWTAVAHRYAENETVSGYDLMNEPAAPSGAALVADYRKLIDAIRKVDREHVIWVEGNKLATDLSVFSQPLGPNVGYSIHVYTFGSDRRAQQLGEASAASARLRAPILVGEMGVASYDNVAKTVSMIEAAPGTAGWSYWTWKRTALGTPSPCPLTLPQSWKAVARWVTGGPFSRRPSAQALQTGLNDLIAFLKSERCTPDPRIIAALTPRSELRR